MGKRRWLILALGLLAQTASCMFQFGLPYLLPVLRDETGISLGEAGVIVAAPSTGLLLTLVLWGIVVDRTGERLTMAVGLGLSGVLILVAALAHPGGSSATLVVTLLCGAAGAAGASVNAASGRVVLGWFPENERGLAMGLRQTAQPLGVALAALTMPSAGHALGFAGALVIPGIAALVVAAAVLAGVKDPPRTQKAAAAVRTASPYRTPLLWRIHASSAMLVVAQFTISTFAYVFLVEIRHWDPGLAGGVLAAVQFAGAAARVLAGVWSDRVRSRLWPMRWLAVVNAVTMAVLAAGALTGSWIAVPALLIASVITVSPNGLAFTAVAELAGGSWAGRALGVHNTGQNLTAALTAPALGALIGVTSYGAAFAIAVVFPLLAGPVLPVTAERARANA